MISLAESVNRLVQPSNQTGFGIGERVSADGILRRHRTMKDVATLQELLSARTRDAAPELVERIDRNRLRCYACGHQCPIPEGAAGVCKVRFNADGRLRVPWGYVAGVQCDPVEKKPFFHAYPGALAYSFGMLGCDLHCSYCQNWVTSQALRDPQAVAPPREADPQALVDDALAQGARIMVSTYNEPLITAEWAVDVFKAARQHGLVTGFVSNGNGTPRVLEYLRPHIVLYKVDLKSFDDRHYRELGGRLQPILDTIQWLHRAGVWVEIVTLLVPGFNDSDAELRGLTAFLASVSPDIPWHVTAFHQDYRMHDPANTTPAMLQRAAHIGREAGLRYIYAGNLPGRVGALEHTHCHACGERLISRYGYLIQDYNITPAGGCPRCATPVPGRWSAGFEGQKTALPFLPADRTRLRVI
jgi:pyruvate formate lyase activating enzyme